MTPHSEPGGLKLMPPHQHKLQGLSRLTVSNNIYMDIIHSVSLTINILKSVSGRYS